MQEEMQILLELPEQFLLRMQELLPEEEYRAFLSSYGRKRLFSLRVNILKCTRAQCHAHVSGLEEAVSVEGADDGIGGRCCAEGGLRPVPWEPDAFYYPEELRPGRLPWHEAGMYYIQEASAMAPAVLCGARPGERVLDLCAAPGGKSTKLAAGLRGEGLLVANEIHPERARVLSANLERMGVRNALVTNEPPQKLASRFPAFFDRIVVDAPCSGEGMFRKEPQALEHWSVENVRMCAARQREILAEAAGMLRPGGTMVYSTCTFSREENEDTVRWFLQEHPAFSLADIWKMPGMDPEGWGFRPGSLKGTARLWPHRLAGEGHFAAVLQKAGPPGTEPGDLPLRSPAAPERTEKRAGPPGTGSGDLPLRPLAAPESTEKKEKRDRKNRNARNTRPGRPDRKKGAGEELPRSGVVRLWEEFREENLAPGEALALPAAEENYVLFGETLYACPVPADSLPLEGLRVLRAGLQLGAVRKGRFVPSHSLAMALRREEARRFLDLPGDGREAYAFLRGESIPVSPDREGGWTLVLFDGCAAGWGKVSGGMLKNHYPRGLRRDLCP